MAADIVRISIEGLLPNGEVWSVNPCYQIADSGADNTFTEVNSIAAAIAGLTIPTGVRGMYNSNTSINSIRVETRKYNGTLELLAEAAVPAVVFGSGSASHPFQTSMVTSLRTEFPGARGRGRLYWPATGVPILASTLRPATSEVTAALTGVKSYLSAIQTAINAQIPVINLVVWSRVGGTSHQVTRLLQGDILDTQRRRRDSLAETYQAVAYP